MGNTVYLIPSTLDDTALHTIAPYVLTAVKDCQVIFAENERTARRFLKAMDRTIVIDDFEWFAIHKAEEEQLNRFREKIREGKNIAIISEAGCPGVADPGQLLVEAAQKMNAQVKPLVGPSSIILALMASGMNGQHFEFHGYLPIDAVEKAKTIRQMEADSLKKKCTQLFIETPYRNNQLVEVLLKTCQGNTRLCIASELTGPGESVVTKSISDWKKEKTDYHKKPVIFLLQAG